MFDKSLTVVGTDGFCLWTRDKDLTEKWDTGYKVVQDNTKS